MYLISICQCVGTRFVLTTENTLLTLLLTMMLVVTVVRCIVGYADYDYFVLYVCSMAACCFFFLGSLLFGKYFFLIMVL